MNISIFLIYFKDAPIIRNKCLVPIQGGRAIAKKRLPMIGDDTGDNISAKNPLYCEFSTLYWAWKNCKSDYVGFFHYRRFLNLAGKDEFVSEITASFYDRYGLTPETIEKACGHADLLLPEWLELKEPGCPNLYEHFCIYHKRSDMDLALDIIRRKYPQMVPAMERAMFKKRGGYFCGLCVMKRELLEKYATWMFDVLFEMESKLIDDIKKRDSVQIRGLAYVAERIFNVFMEYIKELGYSYKEFTTLTYMPDMSKLNVPSKVIDVDSQKTIDVQRTNAQPDVSVIVACYNVSKYIDAAIKSVVDQTLRNIEIILVNDGSKDCTPEILEQWASTDSRIRVVSHENIGLGLTRLSGLKVARGKYIHFFDGDDIMSPEFLEKLYGVAVTFSPDIVIGNHRIFRDSPSVPIATSEFPEGINPGRILTPEIAPRLLLLPCHVWDKLYRRDILDDDLFVPYGCEDIWFWWKLVSSPGRTFSVTKAANINYRENMLSIQSEPKKILSGFDTMNKTSAMIANKADLVQQCYQVVKYMLIGHMVYRATKTIAANHKFAEELFAHIKQFLSNPYPITNPKLIELLQSDGNLLHVKHWADIHTCEQWLNECAIEPLYKLKFKFFCYAAIIPFSRGAFRNKCIDRCGRIYGSLMTLGVPFASDDVSVCGFRRVRSPGLIRYYCLGIPLVSIDRFRVKFMGITVKDKRMKVLQDGVDGCYLKIEALEQRIAELIETANIGKNGSNQ